jgi:hypothetical protein
MLSDDLVQELGDAAIRGAGGLFQGGFHGSRDTPSIDLSLCGHALQCSAHSPIAQSWCRDSWRRRFALTAWGDLGLNSVGGFVVIDIYDENTNQLIGSITEADLQVLVDALEEESLDDHDYYITAETIDVVADGRATEHLVKVLREALGEKEGVDIRWQRR